MDFNVNHCRIAIFVTAILAIATHAEDTKIVNESLDAEIIKLLAADKAYLKAIGKWDNEKFPDGITTEKEYDNWRHKFFDFATLVTKSQDEQFKLGKFNNEENLRLGQEYIVTLKRQYAEAKVEMHPITRRWIDRFSSGKPKNAELEVLVRLLHVLTKK